MPIAELINIIDDDDCGPTTCMIQAADCVGAAGRAPDWVFGSVTPPSAPAFPIWLEGTHPNFVVKMPLTLEDGWTTTVCVSCDSVKQTYRVTFDGWQVQQVRNCATSLVARTGSQSYGVTHLAGGSRANQALQSYASAKDITAAAPGVPFTAWQLFSDAYTAAFDDLEAVYCPVTSCNLYQPGCQVLLDEQDSQYVTMGQARPWPLTAYRSAEDGYTVDFCIKCHGDLSIVSPSAQVDELSIRYIRNCKTHI